MNDTTLDLLVDEIPIMESFYTIQGEGCHVGKAAYFIRTGGCDVGCHWCDVKASWEAKNHPVFSVDHLVEMANEHPAEIVVITGGEPLMYDLSQLTQQLKAANKNTHIETSGVYPLTGDWDWICFSPKKFKKPREVFYEQSDELKLVIYHKSDFKWAIEHSKKMNPKAKWLLQPEWSRQEEILPLIIAFVKEYPRWSISLQTHKFMDIP